MVGETNGVTAHMKGENPHIVVVHCANHRVHLGVSKAAEAVPNVKSIQILLATVYSHINNCPNRLARFKDMAAILTMTAEAEAAEAVLGGAPRNEADDRVQYKYLKFKKVTVVPMSFKGYE